MQQKYIWRSLTAQPFYLLLMKKKKKKNPVYATLSTSIQLQKRPYDIFMGLKPLKKVLKSY